MKKLIFTLAFLSSFRALAVEDAVVLKSLNCQGATLNMVLEVVQETYPGSAAVVGWKVRDTETGRSTEFMGYLFTDGSLKEFHSTDLGSSVEVSGSVAVLSWDDKEEALLCK